MTGATEAGPTEPVRTIRLLLFAAGGLLLADSLSQVILALAPWQPASEAWRVAGLRLLLTQVTPLALAGTLLLLALARDGRSWGWAGVVTLVIAAGAAVLTVAWVTQAPRSSPGLTGGAPDAQHRSFLQATVSAFTFVAGLTAAGVMAWKARRTDVDG